MELSITESQYRELLMVVDYVVENGELGCLPCQEGIGGTGDIAYEVSRGVQHFLTEMACELFDEGRLGAADYDGESQ